MTKMTKVLLPPRINCVYITDDAKEILDLIVFSAKGEVSGLGTVKLINRHDLLIEEVFLLKQKCTPVETVLDQKDVARLINEMVREGRDTSLLKLWWHSHVEMPVFWSLGTDEVTISKLGRKWMLSLVCNKFGDMLARLDIYDPVRVTLDNLPIQIQTTPSDELRQRVLDEMSEKIDFSEISENERLFSFRSLNEGSKRQPRRQR